MESSVTDRILNLPDIIGAEDHDRKTALSVEGQVEVADIDIHVQERLQKVVQISDLVLHLNANHVPDTDLIALFPECLLCLLRIGS